MDDVWSVKWIYCMSFIFVVLLFWIIGIGGELFGMIKGIINVLKYVFKIIFFWV